MPQVQTLLEADKLERVYLFLIKMSQMWHKMDFKILEGVDLSFIFK